MNIVYIHRPILIFINFWLTNINDFPAVTVLIEIGPQQFTCSK
jgi:hypothetical protein